jgi:hypothetical protein
MPYNPLPASASLTVSSTAVGLSSPPRGANMAILTVHSHPIRFLVDGTTPTTSLGHYAADKYEIVLKRTEISNFKAIREGGTDATITVSYFSGSPDPDD